jgi:hypothetical protein
MAEAAAEDEPPTKKRTLSSRLLAVSGDECKLGTSSQKLLLIHQRQQIETLEAELAHEISSRRLHEQQSLQTVRRLEQHLELVKKDAAAEQKLLTERLTAKEERIEQLTLSRDQTRQLNQQLEYKLQEVDEQLMEATSNRDPHRIELLEEKLEAAEQREEQYQQELESLRREMEQRLHTLVAVHEQGTQIQQRLVEEAPPEILTALSKSRTQLAEQERINRHWQRQLEKAQKRHSQLLKEMESLQKQASAAVAWKKERDVAVHELNVAAAELAAWQDFGRDANAWMHRNASSSLSSKKTGPPEVSTIRRFVETAQLSVENASKQNEMLRTRCDELQQKLTAEQEKNRILTDVVADRRPQEAEYQSRLAALQEQLQAALRQSELYQRENESLQTLMQTFELQIMMGQKKKQQGGGGDDAPEQPQNPALQTLRVQLEAAQGRCQEWQTTHDALTKDLVELKQSEDALRSELDRVKEKFGKLRDALTTERDKVTDAEARAVAAETLAARGSFDPATTRVLHFTATPMEALLKEEVAVLKRQLEVKAASSAGGGSAATAGLEPGKLHERLQQTFKEQIALFRDGVHLITGFKIDMLNYGSEQPLFRLRSVFAEHEDDHLMFQWPRAAKPQQGRNTSSSSSSVATAEGLNLLSTDFAKSLTRTPPYDYMTKYNSMPAFTASLQLTLFEKQTMMM